mmetsp:Transcript_2115/g.5593  ORF Transcript_2115/g.5593 Transcript_2115/m.5593 type:complete len:226 (-) Transcript_2115:321-998(-)
MPHRRMRQGHRARDRGDPLRDDDWRAPGEVPQALRGARRPVLREGDHGRPADERRRRLRAAGRRQARTALRVGRLDAPHLRLRRRPRHRDRRRRQERPGHRVGGAGRSGVREQRPRGPGVPRPRGADEARRGHGIQRPVDGRPRRRRRPDADLLVEPLAELLGGAEARGGKDARRDSGRDQGGGRGSGDGQIGPEVGREAECRDAHMRRCIPGSLRGTEPAGSFI